jgi:hypothetical protein
MRTTLTGLAAVAVLALGGSLAHADPFCGGPPAASCNSPFYAASPSGGWYGPNWRFRGPSLPPAPFNGMLAVPSSAGYGGMPAPGVASFLTHPFARSPRDYFMYGQEHND